MLMQNTNEKRKICSLCGKPYRGFPRSAWPINDGVCCEDCTYRVTEARLNRMGIASVRIGGRRDESHRR